MDKEDFRYSWKHGDEDEFETAIRLDYCTAQKVFIELHDYLGLSYRWPMHADQLKPVDMTDKQMAEMLEGKPEYDDTGQESLPEHTLSTRIDDLLWSDCDTCRYVRLGIVIGATVISAINIGLHWLT